MICLFAQQKTFHSIRALRSNSISHVKNLWCELNILVCSTNLVHRLYELILRKTFYKIIIIFKKVKNIIIKLVKSNFIKTYYMYKKLKFY